MCKTRPTLLFFKFEMNHLSRFEKDGENLEINQIILFRFEMKKGYEAPNDPPPLLCHAQPPYPSPKHSFYHSK